MNNLTQFTTTQLIEELIRRKLIEFTRYPLRINITTELINELRKNEYWEKWLNPKCRECGKWMASGDLCWECSEKLKKEKSTFNCQECQTPIKSSPPDEKGRKVLEFYGKWTGKGHNLVCQKCLEKQPQ